MDMVADGAMEGVERIFALHCDPRLRVGRLGTRVGPITSASHRSSASTFTSGSPWCPASSVASTCSTKRSRSASDRKHARDYLVLEKIVSTLEAMDPQYPKADPATLKLLEKLQ